MPRNRYLTAALSSLVLVRGAAGCSSDDRTPAPPASHLAILAEFTRHLPGLDEDVRYVLAENAEGGSYKFVVRNDGREQAPGAVAAEEAAAYSERYGSMDVDLGRLLDVASNEDLIPVGVMFEPDVEWIDLEPRLLFDDDTGRRARQELDEGVRRGAPLWIGELTRRGARETKALPGMPVVVAQMRRDQILDLAHAASVRRIVSAVSTAPIEYAPPATASNAITTPRIDTELNPAFKGTGQKIGVVEDANCRLLSEHANFPAGSVVHEPGADFSCSTDTGCGNRCGGSSLCMAFECVDEHTSHIASTIMNTVNPGTFGAPQAKLYVPTRGDGTSIACSTLGIANAYEWLRSSGVTTTTESFGCSSSDGMTQDYHARYNGMAVFRASGNISQEENTLRPCRPMNSICVGGMRPKSGGGWEMDPQSTWVNPVTTHGDREEPDIVALSENVDVIKYARSGLAVSDPPVTTGWEPTASGTSYAAPAMAGLAALLKQACGGTIDPRYLRALLMTSAWSMNPNGTKYSTPGAGDGRDGAGGLTASKAALWCGIGSGTIVVGGGPFTATLTGGSNTPPWMDGGRGAAPQSEGLADESAAQVVPLGPNPNSPFKYFTIASWSLAANTRVRATVTWDSCPSGPSGTGPGTLRADIDLWLCRPSAQTCVAMSRSYDNNVEGFDVTVSTAGAYEVRWGYDPQNSPGCNGPQEPAAFSFAYGPAGAF